LTSEFDDLSGTKNKVLNFSSSKGIIIKFLGSISGVLEVEKFPREPEEKEEFEKELKKRKFTSMTPSMFLRKKFTRMTPFFSTPRTFVRMILSIFSMAPRKRYVSLIPTILLKMPRRKYTRSISKSSLSPKSFLKNHERT
jgi:hypothetical protein